MHGDKFSYILLWYFSIWVSFQPCVVHRFLMTREGGIPHLCKANKYNRVILFIYNFYQGYDNGLNSALSGISPRAWPKCGSQEHCSWEMTRQNDEVTTLVQKSVHTSLVLYCGADVSVICCCNSTQLPALKVKINLTFIVIPQCSDTAITVQWMQCRNATQCNTYTNGP